MQQHCADTRSIERISCFNKTIIGYNLKLLVSFWCNFTRQCVLAGSISQIPVSVSNLDP